MNRHIIGCCGIVLGLLVGRFVTIPIELRERDRYRQQTAVAQGHAEWVITQGPPDVEFEFRWLEMPAVEQDCAAAIDGSDYMTRSK